MPTAGRAAVTQCRVLTVHYFMHTLWHVVLLEWAYESHFLLLRQLCFKTNVMYVNLLIVAFQKTRQWEVSFYHCVLHWCTRLSWYCAIKGQRAHWPTYYLPSIIITPSGKKWQLQQVLMEAHWGTISLCLWTFSVEEVQWIGQLITGLRFNAKLG